MQIPHRLSHLRTDRRGIPVPYINMWGSADDVDLLRIRFDPYVRGFAVFQDDSEQEAPDFTRQNIHRQRECMVRGLCQVCARPVPWTRRYLIISSISTEQITMPGRGKLAVVFEPWLDELCGRFALERCPGLIRRQTAEGPPPDPGHITRGGRADRVPRLGQRPFGGGIPPGPALHVGQGLPAVDPDRGRPRTVELVGPDR